MKDGERRLRQEDCNEDALGPGILTLTNRRVAFDKTRARIMDFSKNVGETILDVPLRDVTEVWKEGLLMKKVCFKARTGQGLQTYKFGVFNSGSWANAIRNAVEEDGDQNDSSEIGGP